MPGIPSTMGPEKLDDTDHGLAEQVAVNTDNITRLFAEQEKQRDKLHVLESDRATVLLLAQKVDNLARDLPQQVRHAAELAAEKVAATAAQARTSSWQVRLGITAAVIAAVGIVVQAALQIHS